MKKFQFVSRFAASAAALALTLGSVVSFSACSDDDEIDNSGIKSRLDVPTVNAVSAETDITKTSLTFSWEAVKDATGYQAQIRLSETGDILREQISENTTVTFENLNSGTEYFFRVCATYKYDEGRNSAYSAFVSATTEEADPTRPTFDVPAEVRCNMGETTEASLTFTWQSVEGAQKYNVLLTAIGEDDRTFETTETSYTFNGLTTGVKYFFQVQVAEIPGEGGTNASNWSGAVKATTTAKLTTPQNLQLKVKMAQAAQFVWDEVEGAKTYQYELITLTETGSSTPVMEGFLNNMGDNFTPGATVYATSTTNNSISFFGLEKKSYYAFRVKAVAAADQTETVDSEFTDQYVFRTLEFDPVPLSAPAFSISKIQQLRFTASWKAVLNAYGFDFQIATAADVRDGNEAGYVTRKIRATNETTGAEEAPSDANPLPLEIAVGATVTDSYATADPAPAITLAPNSEYMFRMMTIADPGQMIYGDSQWSEWVSVKTLDLAAEVTVDATDKLSESVSRVSDGGTLILEAGTYEAAQVNFSRGITIKAAAGATPKLVLTGTFGLEANAKIGTIELNGLEIQGTGASGSHIFNSASSGFTATVENLNFVNCYAYNYDRSFIRTQTATTNIKNIRIENTTVKLINTQTYDVCQLGASPETIVVKNSTFDNIAAFIRINAALAEKSTITVENCSFVNTRSGGQLFRLTGAYEGCTMSNCVFAGAVTVKVGNNAASANYVTPSNNFAASDLTFSSMGDHASWATAETLTSADLFPNAASGDYSLAPDSQAAAAGAGAK
ncbi:MAG: fibronectin type III domain-containing protein [Alistipes sp.]|nr:fibronectin type III domain-containing protein [Alistipes sp.]